MAPSRSAPGPPPHWTTATKAVLREILFIYPEVLTLDELARQLTFASDAFTQRDRIERAVRDLTAAGLLHQVGPLVLPTRTAIVFDRLAEL